MTRRLLLLVPVLALVVSCSGQPAPEPVGEPTTGTTSVEPEPDPEEEPEPIAVSGVVALGGGAVIHDMPSEGLCSAHSQFTDIKAGEQVEIHDASGAVVAITELNDGKRFGDTEDCVWSFDVEVPAGGGFYSASVLEWESDTIAEADLGMAIVTILPAG
jgi:hypothetical protein